MAPLITIQSVRIKNVHSNFFEPIKFQIMFKCERRLRDVIICDIRYIGNGPNGVRDVRLYLASFRTIRLEAGEHGYACHIALQPMESGAGNQVYVMGKATIRVEIFYGDTQFALYEMDVQESYSEPLLQAAPPRLVQFDKMRLHFLQNTATTTLMPINWNAPVPDELGHDDELSDEYSDEECDSGFGSGESESEVN